MHDTIGSVMMAVQLTMGSYPGAAMSSRERIDDEAREVSAPQAEVRRMRNAGPEIRPVQMRLREETIQL